MEKWYFREYLKGRGDLKSLYDTFCHKKISKECTEKVDLEYEKGDSSSEDKPVESTPVTKDSFFSNNEESKGSNWINSWTSYLVPEFIETAFDHFGLAFYYLIGLALLVLVIVWGYLRRCLKHHLKSADVKKKHSN
jgi:hypothetical protein